MDYHFQLWHTLAGSPFLLLLLKDVRKWVWGAIKLKAKKEIAEDGEDQDKPVTRREMDILSGNMNSRLDTLGQIVHAAATDMTASAQETRETLIAFKMGIDTSLGQAHEKANSALLEAAKLEGRITALEKRAS